MFKFLSGGVKGFIESLLYQVIGVERNAKIALKAEKKKDR